jgi:hypothetical protein
MDVAIVAVQSGASAWLPTICPVPSTRETCRQRIAAFAVADDVVVKIPNALGHVAGRCEAHEHWYDTERRAQSHGAARDAARDDGGLRSVSVSGRRCSVGSSLLNHEATCRHIRQLVRAS